MQDYAGGVRESLEIPDQTPQNSSLSQVEFVDMTEQKHPPPKQIIIKPKTHIARKSIVDHDDSLSLIDPDACRIRDQVIIYEYMCYRASRKYSYYSKFLTIPSIFLSSAIAFLNSNLGQDFDPNKLQLVNVVGNSTLTLVLTLRSTLKFSERSDYFFNLKTKFAKLHNKLNNEFAKQRNNTTFDTTSQDFVNITQEYNNLDENIAYQFPDDVIDDVRIKFGGHYMPTICNGIERKKNEDESASTIVRTVSKWLGKAQPSVYTIPSPV